MPSWRNMDVNIRQYSCSWSTARGHRPPRLSIACADPPPMMPVAPTSSSITNMMRLRPMRTLVAERPAAPPMAPALHPERIWPRVTTLAREPRALCSLTHSGQRKPTGAGIMQSWQIGRPQLEHETPVSRSG